MILLDTNVISELRRKHNGPDPRVARWIAEQVEETLFLSAVTILEIERGVLRRARRDERQGRAIRDWLEQGVLPRFAGRILAFDADVARACAALHIPVSRPELDTMIAATALVHNLTVATRNTSDFAGTGVRLINPWQA